MTDFDHEKPKLRQLDIQPVEHDGSAYLMLRDPLLIHDRPVFVPQQLVPLLSLCDGTRNLAALRGALAMRYGLFLPTDRIHENLAALDDGWLLENTRFQQKRVEVQAAFRTAPFRPASCAGQSYPEARQELAGYLQTFLNSASPGTMMNGRVRGLISPHIDFQRGGPVYAQTWGAAAESVKQAEIAVIFGTDHYSEGMPFSLTRQSYSSPYGILPTSGAVVDALAAAIGPEHAFAGELHHRREHSIELAAVWMQHIRAGSPIETVPILVGPLERSGLVDEALVTSVLGELARAIHGKRSLIIAAGDMAHVGPVFDTDPVDSTKRQSLQLEDDALLNAICHGDADGFLHRVQADGDANNICGLWPIYLALRLLSPSNGHRLGYSVCPADADGASVVTICGVAFE